MPLLSGSLPYWISANYSSQSRGYYWEIIKPNSYAVGLIHHNFGTWLPGEPNLNSVGACVALKPQEGKFIDEGCSLRYHVICQDTSEMV